MRFLKLACVLVLATAGLSGPVHAQSNFICIAKPQDGLGLTNAGAVVVAVDGVGVLNICSVSGDMGGVTKESCTAWYSAFLTWRETGKSAYLYFTPPNVGGATSCSQFSSWDVRVPYYMAGV